MNANDAIRLFAKTLQNLEHWMDKAAEHAKAKSFEVDVLAQARLAPDQYELIRQVQSACDRRSTRRRTSAASRRRHPTRRRSPSSSSG
jgi:hypothetical protein